MITEKLQYSKDELGKWLTDRVSAYVRQDSDEIEIEGDIPLSTYGFDSVYSLSLVGEIEDYLKLSIEPAIMWDNTTINMLTLALLDLINTHK